MYQLSLAHVGHKIEISNFDKIKSKREKEKEKESQQRKKKEKRKEVEISTLDKVRKKIVESPKFSTSFNFFL